MPGRKDQRNQKLKQVAQFCSKLTNIFKKLKLYEKSKKLSASENQDIATSNFERVKVSYLFFLFYDGKILADVTVHYQYFHFCENLRSQVLVSY